MTTWESTDNENLIVTSDVAYERVTSDEHFEEEKNWWYLQQNTSWLVQEIPNISFLDIADTMLESKKTLYGKNNWNVVVWAEWKSIEAVPQDSLNSSMSSNQSMSSWTWIVDFDRWDVTDNGEILEIHHWVIKILKDWYYRISYWWTIDLWGATNIVIDIEKDNWGVVNEITWDDYQWLSASRISWWRSVCVQLVKWDEISMNIAANSPITVLKKYTYLQVQYIWQSI